MSSTAVDHYIQEFEKQIQPSWLKEVRNAALDEVRNTGFPTLRSEDWKYTDIRPITKRNFLTNDSANDEKAVDMESINKLSTLACDRLVFLNGTYMPDLSSIEQSNDDITIQSLREILSTDPDLISDNFKLAGENSNVFASLNTAFLADGAFISVGDNQVLDKPVHLLFITDKTDAPIVNHLRNYITIGKHASATIIESYIGVGEIEYLTNTMTEISVSEGGVLGHYKLEEESLKGFHIGNFHARLGRDSRVNSYSFSIGGALVRNQMDCDLIESGAHVNLNGLYVGDGRQHIDNHTVVNHVSPHTSSDEEYRGILNDRARGVFNGKVIVHQDAQKTDARQYNANLLLSDNVEIDTKPELEIYADDVKCSHGATIGQLDENMLFYLRSRALDDHTAKSLLTFAFADEVISRIDIPEIRTHLEPLIVGKLPDAELIQEFIT